MTQIFADTPYDDIESNISRVELMYTDGTLTWIRLGSIHCGGSRHVRLIHRLKTEPINFMSFFHLSQGHTGDKLSCIKHNPKAAISS